MFHAAQLLRYAKIKAVRDNFYQSTGHICDEPEHRAGSGNRTISEVNSLLETRAAAEICSHSLSTSSAVCVWHHREKLM